MKQTVAFLMGCLLLGASVGVAGNSSKDDLKQLQGKWTIESRIVDGKPSEKTAEKSVWEITGDRVIYHPEASLHAVLRLDATQKPKAFDFDHIDKDPSKTKKGIKGIYKIEGDTWTICVAPTGKERPTAFESKEGSGYVLTVRKRVKDEK